MIYLLLSVTQKLELVLIEHQERTQPKKTDAANELTIQLCPTRRQIDQSGTHEGKSIEL